MRPFWRFFAGICHVLTIIGGLYAAVVLFESLRNISYRDMPDFSAVIAISFVIIPYCLGKAFQGLADMSGSGEAREEAQCPACLEMVPFSASKCRHCHSELIPLTE